VLHRIRYIQELFSILIVQGEPVRTGEVMTPGTQQLAARIIDQDIIMRLVSEQEDPAFFVLHHFVAVVHGKLLGIRLAPGRIQPVAHAVVAIHFTFLLCKKIFHNEKAS